METIEIKGKKVPAEWFDPETYGAIVSKSGDGFVDDDGYGGHVICESAQHRYKPLIAASPQLFVSLKNLVADVSSGSLDSESLQVAAELIAGLEKTP